MAAEPYFGDSMTLSVTDPQDGDVPVAGLQSVSVMLSAEHIELFTADSIKRESVKKRELSVPVEVEYAKFDETFAQWWMGVTSAGSSIEDTSDVALFSIEGTITSANGDTTLEGSIDDVYFEEMPLWEASEGEFVSQSLSGTGADVSNFAPAGTT
ncbi:hypothetical protein HALLA_12125 [Halostagnicola larsenii XH-48]|uniref:Uncharacterized protein n=1 Tax=Halostagnicola larsenii XH-48 TaxID=797299 RepID=W0JUG9_9EURY|nr:hypothetical protein [Halostagnicola larsenii]AHG00923.1 hypothetical protein HALLA_11825 [Halostagnicola larsenii XH-48]AHG00972.1 hypothetical protein HALLA_12125 [Halostagnicola larsenii XH-48]